MVRQANIGVLVQDVLSFALCFMSWAAVFGGPFIDWAAFGAVVAL